MRIWELVCVHLASLAWSRVQPPTSQRNRGVITSHEASTSDLVPRLYAERGVELPDFFVLRPKSFLTRPILPNPLDSSHQKGVSSWFHSVSPCFCLWTHSVVAADVAMHCAETPYGAF